MVGDASGISGIDVTVDSSCEVRVWLDVDVRSYVDLGFGCGFRSEFECRDVVVGIRAPVAYVSFQHSHRNSAAVLTE